MKTPVKSLMLTVAISALAVTPPVIGVVSLSAEPAAAQGASGNAGGGGAGGGGSSNAGGGGAGGGSSNAGGGGGSSNAGGASANAGGGAAGGGGSSNAGGNAASSNAGSAASGGAASGGGNGGAGDLADQAADKAASRGALASELKGLNAAHANPTALDNADPDSQVGRIATYRDAAQDTQDAQAAVDVSQQAIDDLVASYDGRSSDDILADIDALDPDDDGYDDALAELQAELEQAEAHEAELAELEAELAEALLAYDAALADEEEALLAASDGRELSDAALAELRSLLGL